MLFYPAALPLSRQTLTYTAGVIRRHRKQIGSPWRKLNPGQQALLVLAYLRKGETFADLAAGLITLGDRGYHGAGDPVITPYKGRSKPESQKAANRAHAKLRGPGERANAQLKSWRILRKLRCYPWRAGQLAKAIHILQTREIGG
jgi:DDE superfamily endonuclease/Helix-turn-helix of DDE superfamily endonuclease